MSSLARWVLAHRRLVALGWLIVAVVGAATVSSATKALSQKFDVPGREGSDTNAQIAKLYHSGGSANPVVPVVTLPAGETVSSPGVRPQLEAAFAKIGRTLPGARVASFASTGNRAFVSRDGRTTFALIYPPDQQKGMDLPTALIDAAKRAASASQVAGSPVHLTGITLLSTSGGGGGGPGVLLEAVIGGLGALVVLGFVFASFIAFVPLVMAIVSILTTFLLVYALTALTEVSAIVQFLIALIGLGVAIDYSLLIVVRWREERQKGADNDTAVITAATHAGRAVLFSGTTVAIGLLSLVVLPVPFLRSVGYGGLLIPLVSVAVAVTLLPVILATIGPRLDWPHVRHDDRASRAWTRWARLIVRRRGIAAALAIVFLAALAIPSLQLYPGNPKADSLAKTGDARVGLLALEKSGIGTGALTPFEGLVRGNPAPVVLAAEKVSGIRGALAPAGSDWRQNGTALITVMPKDDGNSQRGRDTLDRLRAATHNLPGAPRYGGDAAEAKDFVSAVYGNFALMLALVAIVTFVLLARAFRSLVLPLKAVLLNLLSVAAAFGVLVLIWQDGYGSQAIWGIKATGAITQFVPLMVFAFLFGLSMDYEVFIISRIREEYDRTGDTNHAVVEGIGRTGRLVTSAALILFLAFSSLASGPETTIKIFASGLAIGIMLDAAVVRGLLVPALVSLFGRWNWWMPHLAAKVLRLQPTPSTGRGHTQAPDDRPRDPSPQGAPAP